MTNLIILCIDKLKIVFRLLVLFCFFVWFLMVNSFVQKARVRKMCSAKLGHSDKQAELSSSICWQLWKREKVRLKRRWKALENLRGYWKTVMWNKWRKKNTSWILVDCLYHSEHRELNFFFYFVLILFLRKKWKVKISWSQGCWV